MDKLYKFLINTIMGILISILTVGTAVISVLNMTFIYKYFIYELNIANLVGISSDKILEDYKTLIEYLQNPCIEKLQFKNFAMSANGEFHFYEVKRIFLFIYTIVLISIIILIIGFIIYKIINKKNIKNKVIELCNYSSNVIMATIIVLLTVIVTDFSRAFIVFHEIVFSNDYWIFDPATDPIIEVLPEEVFKIYAIIILIIIAFVITIFKVLYYKSIKKQ